MIAWSRVFGQNILAMGVVGGGDSSPHGEQGTETRYPQRLTPSDIFQLGPTS
jgi:hypothetical protein